jgi:methionine-rich copper-binding protein CopC
MLPALTTAAVAVGLLLIAAAPAAAHNYIVSSTPAEGEVLTAMPNEWIITTNENLLDLSGQGSGFAFLVADSEGLYYGDGCVTVEGPAMTMPAALGGAGDYVMTYQFISADGHTLSGQLPFTWQAPDDFEPHIGLAEPPVCGETASAPAPPPAPSPTAEPETDATDEAAPDATEPDASDTDGSAVPFIGIAIAVALLGGVIVAIALVARARRQRAQQSTGDAPMVVGDGGSTTRAHTESDADGSSGGDGGGGGD